MRWIGLWQTKSTPNFVSEHSPEQLISAKFVIRMTGTHRDTRSHWCVVVADAAGPEWPFSQDINPRSAPVQFCGFGEPTTMLQKALHRAVRISHPARVMVTAAEVHRSHWQQALWFMRAEHRFVSESPG